MEKRENFSRLEVREAERSPSVQTDSRLPYGGGRARGAPLSPPPQVEPDIITSGCMVTVCISLGAVHLLSEVILAGGSDGGDQRLTPFFF